MNPNEIRQLAESIRLREGAPSDEHAMDAVEKLNAIQVQLQQYAQKVSGTPDWKSFNASVRYGVGREAVLELMANYFDEVYPGAKGSIVTMDRMTIRLKPYKAGSVSPVFDGVVEVSRLVRDTDDGQGSDVQNAMKVRLGDVMLKDITPSALLDSTKKFWSKVKHLKPKTVKKESTQTVVTLDRTLRHAGVALSRPGLSESDAIGKTILQQMGGPGRLAVMLGTRHFSWLPNGVQFKWPNKQRSRGNVCRITLRPDDTYDMEFFNGDKSVKKFEGIYNDQLVELFEKHTGWYLSIGGKRPASGPKPGPEMAPKGTKHESKINELAALLNRN